MRVLALLALLVLPVCRAQEARGTLTGRVTDSSGALVSGAAVRATNTGTNASVSGVTNESGNFEIPYLLPGPYSVSVELQGFKKAVRDGIELRTADRMQLDFVLEVGNLAESVVVTGESPLLETANASVGVIMDERRVQEMPVVGGNAFYLARLSPGVLSVGGRSAGNPMDNGGATDVVVNGTRGGSSEVTLDSSPAMTNRAAVVSIPQDMVQEFRIQTATYDASIGHAAGAVTNVSVKSGTNAIHGTGYYFDSRIRAVPWFTNRFLYDPTTGPITPRKLEQIPTWQHQRWGTTMSGPVVLPKLYNGRNKTFWTFGFEDLNIKRNLALTATVPTLEQRRGDFSGLLPNGARYQIYDPATIAAAPNGRFSRQPFAGNIVPSSRINPVGAKLMTYWPEPNQPGTSDFRNNYYRTREIFRENYTYTVRVDHNFSEKNRFFFRFSNSQHDNVDDTLPGPIFQTILDRSGVNAVIDDVYVVNPGLLVNVRYGWSYQSARTRRGSAGFDLATLGFPRSFLDELGRKLPADGIAFPNITVDGGNINALGISGAGARPVTNYHNPSVIVTRLAGAHSFRFGADGRLQFETNYDPGNVAPQLAFNQGWTVGPVDNSPTAPVGQGMASLLLGLPTGGTINNNASRAEKSKYFGFFVQDDWRLTPRLAVNLGIRYEYETPVTERWNRTIRGFDFETANPISAQARANYARSPIPQVPVSQFSTVGGLLFAGVGGQPGGLWRADRNNFAPRVGMAYTLNKKTVFRAGYGIFFDVLGVDRLGVNQGGFNQPTNFIASLDNGLTFRSTLSNPFVDGIEVPRGAADGVRTFLGRDVSFFNSDPANPYMQRWSASIQRELPMRMVVDVSYVGNRGTKLAANRNLNPTPRQFLSTSPVRDQATIDFLSRQVDNPFFGIPEFAGTPRGNQRISVGNLLRPYPQFGDITVNFPAGYSYFHSMQASFEKRMGHGFQFQASWTWSKFMQATDYLNDTDSYLEKVISDQDFTHRFAISGIYEFPFGKNKAFLGNAPRWLDAFTGGWQFQGWYEGQTGDALGFGNAIFFGDLNNVAIPLSERRAERWFNTGAGFNRDPAQVLASNIRTLNSRFNGIRADGINNFDLSLFKNFRIREGWRAQFRLETFNTLNHVQFDAPNTNPINTAFGQVTAEKGHGQRQVTLSMKVIF